MLIKNNMITSLFHIHYGYDRPDYDTSTKLVKYFDLCCGVPSVLKDTDTYRRTLYGRAGSFRKCKYGVEARSLSSYMLHDEYLPTLHDQIMLAVDMCNDGMPLPESDLIQTCINTSNAVLAKHLIGLYGLIQY